jgi:hypothetical protein
VLVKHLFLTGRVNGGGVRDHVEIEQDGVVLIPTDGAFASQAAASFALLSSSSSPSLLLCQSSRLTDEGSVPDFHGGYVAVVTQDAQGAGIEQEMLASAGGQADPPCHECAQHVSVRK